MTTDHGESDVSSENTHFRERDLRGAKFTDVDLTGAEFREVAFTDVWLRNVDLTGATFRGAMMVNVDINGLIQNVRINDVEVGPLVEAELNRRYPDRPKMWPTDADGYREAWEILTRLWAGTVERARAFAPEALHQRVNDEWSFIETLRHLVFATDAWVSRALLGDPTPWDPLGLPYAEMPVLPGVPRGSDVRPSLAVILALREDRMETVRRVLADLTDEQLASHTEPVLTPGYPESTSFPVSRCLGAILREEWEHRLFAERDLASLAAESASGEA